MTSQRLRVGIIGCGNIGVGSHLPAWQAIADIAEVVGLADPTETTLLAAASLAGLSAAQIHSEARDLLDRDDVDAIDICTPQHLRRELIVEAASRGKHVLCEKPLATIPADGVAAVQAAAEAGTILAMVHNYVWLPEVQAAQRVIDAGEIGMVRAVTVNYLGIVDVPGSAGYVPRWRHDAALAGGGVLMDILHGVYVAETLLGHEVERVSAYADNADPTSNVEDIALCRVETASNAALVNIAWGFGPGGFEIVGTEGRISIIYENCGTAPWYPLDRVIVTTAAGTRIEVQGEPAGQDGLTTLRGTFRYVVKDFAEAALNGGRPRASGADGQRILEAIVGALESAVTGKIVRIPLDPSNPVFRRGVLGVSELDLPDWSPVYRRSLYQKTAAPTQETSA
jgi:predicted dehydrogenase